MLALRRTPFIGSTSHHRDLIAAFVGAVGLISLWAMVGRSILPGVPLGVVITGGIAFTAIRGSLFVARMRGLSVLWSLLVLVWCAFLFGAAEVSDGRFVQFGKQIPIRFAVWSFAALPL